MKLIIPQSDYLSLKETYPDKAEQLDRLAEYAGSKVVIALEDLTPPVKRQLDTELTDHLYRLAYRLREDRFWSYYIQIRTISELPKSKVETIFEIGPGIGIFESLIQIFDYQLFTLDLDVYSTPDVVGNALNIPLQTGAVDLICAFEVLEHLPHRFFQPALKEMIRCARHYVFLSLPCPTNNLFFQFRLTFLQRFFRRFSFKFDLFRTLPTSLSDKNEEELLKREDKQHPHYWEANRRSYPKKIVLKEIENCNLKILEEFQSASYPHHYFILCEKP